MTAKENTSNSNGEDVVTNTEPKSGKKQKRKKDGSTGKLKKEIEELKAENAEMKDKYLRLFAEFDNYKKRNIKEKLDLMKTAAQDTIQALLPVLDDFDRAKKSAEDESNDEMFSEGVTLVYKRLHSILEQKGLQVMQVEGEDFDPEFHEAITEIPAPTPKMSGKIIDTIEKGYTLNEKIIRYAKVVVGK